MTESDLVRTADAARAVGVSTTSLLAWLDQDLVHCEYRTPGGQARWSIPNLRRELGITPPRGDKDEAS